MRRNIVLFLILTFGLIQTFFAQETVPVSNSNGYLLGPGDEIVVKVLGEKDFDFEAILDENGNIEIPFFEKPIAAMCKNERDLKAEVTKLLGKYLRNPQVSLRAKDKFKSRPPTTIYGAVRSPQQVILSRQFRLSELLAVAGGETENAGGIIQVVRPQAPMCGSLDEIAEWKAQVSGPETFPMRLYTLSSVKKGTSESNPIIYPGDIIKVEDAKPIYLVGEVKGGQGGILIKENGLTLFNAISMVGGVNREAKTKDVKIYRQKPNSIDRDILSANYEMIQKGLQKDIPLEPYDVIVVDKTKKSVAQTILELAIGGGRTIFQGVTGGVGTKILY